MVEWWEIKEKVFYLRQEGHVDGTNRNGGNNSNRWIFVFVK